MSLSSRALRVPVTVLTRLRDIFSEATDPVTGDHLSAGEHVSWQIQRVMRRWSFIGAILLITVVCWATRNDAILLWWNLAASLMALVIESIVGMAFFKQALRDAVVIRKSERLEERIERMEREHGATLHALHALALELSEMMAHHAATNAAVPHSVSPAEAGADVATRAPARAAVTGGTDRRVRKPRSRAS